MEEVEGESWLLAGGGISLVGVAAGVGVVVGVTLVCVAEGVGNVVRIIVS